MKNLFKEAEIANPENVKGGTFFLISRLLFGFKGYRYGYGYGYGSNCGCSGW